MAYQMQACAQASTPETCTEGGKAQSALQLQRYIQHWQPSKKGFGTWRLFIIFFPYKLSTTDLQPHLLHLCWGQSNSG